MGKISLCLANPQKYVQKAPQCLCPEAADDWQILFGFFIYLPPPHPTHSSFIAGESVDQGSLLCVLGIEFGMQPSLPKAIDLRASLVPHLSVFHTGIWFLFGFVEERMQ